MVLADRVIDRHALALMPVDGSAIGLAYGYNIAFASAPIKREYVTCNRNVESVRAGRIGSRLVICGKKGAENGGFYCWLSLGDPAINQTEGSIENQRQKRLLESRPPL